MHDGSSLMLHKLAPNDPISIVNALQQAHTSGKILTSLLYLKPDSQYLHATLRTCSTPLNQLSEKELCPAPASLVDISAGFS